MYRIPVPYFKLRSDFSILDVSKEVTHLFYPVTSFLHLVDSESRNKLKRLLNVPSPGKMEINLNTIESPTTLFTIHYNYQPKEEIIHLVCLNESASYNHIQFEFQQIKEKIQSGAWEKVIPTSMEDNTHLQQASRKISKINDLLHDIQHDLESAGKGEYAQLIRSELADIQAYISK